MTADLSAYDPEARLASYDPEAFLTGRRTPVEDVRPPVERHLARKVIEAYLITLVAMRALDWLGLAKRWQTDGWVQEEIDKNVTQQFVHAFSAPMSVLLAQAAHKGHEDARATYKLTEGAAVGVEAWSRTYAAESANTMALAQERALQDTVNDMINQRLPPQVMADRAAAMYGLDPASAQAFNRFSASKSKARSETLPQMLRRLTFRRAKTIADTEIFTAMNFGHQMRLMEAMAMGEIPKSARKRWVTAQDERVCPVCGPMDGIEVPMNDAFEVVMPIPKTSRGKNRKSSFMFVPPVHPNCRCEIELADQDYITPVAPREMVFAKLFDESKHKRDHGKFSSVAQSADTHKLEAGVGLLTGAALVAFWRKPVSSKVVEAIRQTPDFMKYDGKVRGLPDGVHTLNTHYVRVNGQRISFRFDQQGSIDSLARHMQAEPGFLEQNPIVMHVYANRAVVRDGNHRLEAATALGLDNVHVRLVHFPDMNYLLGEGSVNRAINERREAAYLTNALSNPRTLREGSDIGYLRQRLQVLNERLREQDARNRDDLSPDRGRIAKFFNPFQRRGRDGKWTKQSSGDVAHAMRRHPDPAVRAANQVSPHHFENAGLYAGATAYALSVVALPFALSRYGGKEAFAAGMARPLGVSRLLRGSSGGGRVLRANPEPHAPSEIAGWDTLADVQKSFVVGAFHNFEHEGMKTEVVAARLTTYDNVLHVNGNVIKDGYNVGTFIRTVNETERSVYHSMFTISAKEQGSGFGAAFTRHQAKTYKHFGIRKITVHANLDIGGYTWAVTGFQFKKAQDEVELITRMKSYADRGTRGGLRSIDDLARTPMSRWAEVQIYPGMRGYTPSGVARTQMGYLAHRMEKGLEVTPQDIARVGIDDAVEITINGKKTKMWAGKQVLLNASWNGVMPL